MIFNRINISLLILTIALGVAFGELILTEDRAYDVINVKIPQSVWRQAFHPTPPVLKSPVTIVVPVHVPEDDDNEVDNEADEDLAEEDEIIDTTIAPVEDVVSDVAVAAANVTDSPVEDEAPITTEATVQEVTGQVTRFPCSCVRGQCGCCTGSILDRFNMKACGNISFVPEDLVFDVRMSVNNRTVVRRRVSASDPPPICFNPRRAPFVQICAEISNIRIRNRNAFACLDINADIADFPVYSASFRCFGLGASGLQTGLKPKPVSSGPKPVDLFGSTKDEDDDDDGLFGGGGLFGGFGGGSDDDDDGPLGAIGDAVGDFFDGRSSN